MHTPSYPSGHSVQGILVGRAFGKMFKEHKQELYEVGKMISDSRLMEAHYPSDSKFGKQVGKYYFKT